jgi:hypothetical protein
MWCGQCYRPLPGDSDEPVHQTDDAGGGQLTMELALPETPRIGREEWTCTVCGSVNPLTESDCSVCGSSIFEAFKPEPPEPVDARTAMLRSLFLPGLGHAFARQPLLGVSVGALVLVSLALGVVLLVLGVMLAGVALVLIGLGAWGVGVVDAYHWARGETDQVVLRPRVLTVVVAVVLMVLIAVAVATQVHQ